MPNLEQIAAQYSRSRFPQRPYDRTRYEQGLKTELILFSKMI